jgi:hypothetical protein
VTYGDSARFDARHLVLASKYVNLRSKRPTAVPAALPSLPGIPPGPLQSPLGRPRFCLTQSVLFMLYRTSRKIIRQSHQGL